MNSATEISSTPYQRDEWVWGVESILWGYQTDHQYTLKILEPKKSSAGCLSLQYHHEKSETWFVLQGTIWALLIQDGSVQTKLMSKGDFQNLPTGTIHRLMGVTDDAKVLESSTPDRHAADKSAVKDVVRLHCVHGRECATESDSNKAQLIEKAILFTQEAIAELDSGKELTLHSAEISNSGNVAFR